MTTLKDLVNRAKRHGIPAGQPRRTVQDIADAAGVTRQFIYQLIDGSPVSDTLEPRLAKALFVTVATLRKAVRASAA